MQMNLYDIGSRTEKDSDKEHYERNGDNCAWLETEKCVVLALADGVRTCANDAEASQITCEQFVEKCRQYLSSHPVLEKETMRLFCEEIDPVLLDKAEKACFCAVAWKPGENKAAWIHTGDTRIYTYNFRTGLKQITHDDHGKAVLKKENGKLKTLHGAVIASIPVNAAIGDGWKKFHTDILDIHPDESLVLCSDGMYLSPDFENNVKTVLGSVKLNEATAKFSFTNEDDATMLLLRRTDGYARKWTAQELVNEIESQVPTIPRHVLLHGILNALQEVASRDCGEKGVEDSTRLVRLCDSRRLFIVPEQASEILNNAVKYYYSISDGNSFKQVLESFILAMQSYADNTRRFE